jgi:hypothetical protein
VHAAFATFAMAVVGGLTLGPAAAHAQTAPSVTATSIPDDMPLGDYLGLLAQISPAAHDGAQAYLQAFQQRCGRPMRTAELRRAMADGDGDPVLVGMIRASHLRDAAAVTQLGKRVSCGHRRSR